MEILTSKFRSPPPKPPRRRHSDQLSISSSDTYPSSRKKHYDENKLCSRDIHLMTENSALGCGSLPSNWIADFSSDQKTENQILIRNTPYSSIQFSTYQNLGNHVCSVFGKCNDLTEEIMVTDCKNGTQFDWTNKSDFPYMEQVVKDSSSLKCYCKHSVESYHTCNECSSFDNSNCKKLLDPKLFSKEYHKRHHSDPVLSYLDRSKIKNCLQKCTLGGHSFLRTSLLESHRNLCSLLPSDCKVIQCLYEEMKALKEINSKLWEHLCSTQACLEKARNSSEKVTLLSTSDLISSLYCSQKAKDCAMEERMKVILEERDAAIQELEDMVRVIARSFGEDAIEEEKFSNKELKKLLKEIEVTCNPAKLLQQQRMLLTYLYRSKELKQDQILHELKLSVTEKDHLMGKVKRLEEELKCLNVCNEIWNTDNKQWENNLLNILCQVIHQRDIAHSKVDSTQHLDHINSRSSTPENFLPVELLTNDSELLQRRNEINIKTVTKCLPLCNDMKKCQFVASPSDEIRLLKGKVTALSKALETEVEKRERAEDKCLRLERLVSVLQRKVNGQNVGIPV